MKISVHRLFSLLLVSAYSEIIYSTNLPTHLKNTAWENSPVGTCMKKYHPTNNNNLEGMISKIEKNRDIYGNIYTWQIEVTPSSSPLRLLYQTRKNGITCIILMTPYSETVDFSLKNGKLPETIITQDRAPTSEFIETRIIYKKKKSSPFFWPYQCLHYRKDGTFIGKIDCTSAWK